MFAYFAIEMVIKMIAMGVWGKLGYLGDSWNRLGMIAIDNRVLSFANQWVDKKCNFHIICFFLDWSEKLAKFL